MAMLAMRRMAKLQAALYERRDNNGRHYIL
jgi:hypothetical protein